MYEALIMIEQQSFPSVEQYATHLQSFYVQRTLEKPTINIEANGFQVVFSGIVFSLDKNCQSYVREESQEIAQRYQLPDNSQLESVRCRFELSSSSDANMDYFNDYVHIVAMAEKFGKAWIFDPVSGEFL